MATARSRAVPTGSFVPFTIILKCSSGKAMQLKSNALPEQIGRLKLAINPATRFFLVALFIFGFTSSYFGDLRSKTHPQYAANADVENHPPKPAIGFVHAG